MKDKTTETGVEETERRRENHRGDQMSCVKAERWEWNYNSLPDDISLKIAAFLEVQDLCTLGACSRFWRELCDSEFIWRSLFKQRWPALNISENLPIPIMAGTSDAQLQFSSPKGWRNSYIIRHKEMADRATNIIKFVNKCSRCESLEVIDYQKAIANLYAMDLGFKDVEMFFFASKQNALVNSVGLYYSIFWLRIPADYVMQALLRCEVSERKVCVNWWKLGRWSHGYRLRDQSRARKVSLGDLATAKEQEVLEVLHRGAVHEVLRVQISVPATVYTPWTLQNSLKCPPGSMSLGELLTITCKCPLKSWFKVGSQGVD